MHVRMVSMANNAIDVLQIILILATMVVGKIDDSIWFSLITPVVTFIARVVVSLLVVLVMLHRVTKQENVCARRMLKEKNVTVVSPDSLTFNGAMILVVFPVSALVMQTFVHDQLAIHCN